MIKEVKQTKEVITRRKYCDDCGKGIINEMVCSVAKCEICKKDLCYACIGHELETGGDYRVVYCKQCWGIGTEYREKIQQFEDKIEELHKEWKNQCVGNFTSL